MDRLRQDLRFAFRYLRRSPLYTLAVLAEARLPMRPILIRCATPIAAVLLVATILPSVESCRREVCRKVMYS